MHQPKNLIMLSPQVYEGSKVADKGDHMIEGSTRDTNSLTVAQGKPSGNFIVPKAKTGLNLRKGHFELSSVRQMGMFCANDSKKKQKLELLQKEFIGDGCRVGEIHGLPQTNQIKNTMKGLKDPNMDYFENPSKVTRIVRNQKFSESSDSCQSQGLCVFSVKKGQFDSNGREKVKSPLATGRAKSPLHAKPMSPQNRVGCRWPYLAGGYCGELKAARNYRILSSDHNAAYRKSRQNGQPKMALIGTSGNLRKRKESDCNNQKNNQFNPQNQKADRTVDAKRFGSKAKDGKYLSPERIRGKLSQKQLRKPVLAVKKSGEKLSEGNQRTYQNNHSFQNRQKSPDNPNIAQAKYHYYADSKNNGTTTSGLVFNKKYSQKDLNYRKANTPNSKEKIVVDSKTPKKDKIPQLNLNNVTDERFIENLSPFRKTSTPQYKAKGIMFTCNQEDRLRAEVRSDGEEKSGFKLKKKESNQSNASKNTESHSYKLLSFLSHGNQKNISRALLRLTSICLKQSPKVFQFEVLKKLAEHRQCCVYVVLHRETRSIYALKSFPKKEESLKNFINESKIQFSVKHPNSIKIYGVMHDEKCFYLLMQYLEQGTLLSEQREMIKKSFKQLQSSQESNSLSKLQQEASQDREKHIKEVLLQILEVLVYLHRRGIIHRDVKPENIFISNKQYKLGDYGSSTFTNSQEHIGTLDYAAPEILQQLPYDKSIDMFSFGCIVFEMVIGYPPFYHEERNETFRRIVNVEYDWKSLKEKSQPIADLVQKLLRADPKERISAQEAIQHQVWRRGRPRV